ncbi:MAG: 30S ribosomal protein THX [Cytophagales bacterium]|nr:30S ribosomal protein THX [Cytophagales bacterium]
MGKGDKKSKKGKIAMGSYGVSRNKKAIKARLRRGNSKPAPAPAPAVVVAPVEVKPKAKRAPKKKASTAE